ncbi:MAG: hypothetical protein SGJ24_04895 [Chloroflexota bacterium]|nr:hypothetical protein [Chloroflexota bacterium]
MAYDVFLSYSRHDSAIMERVRAVLTAMPTAIGSLTEADIPEGWRIIRGDGVEIAVPANWTRFEDFSGGHRYDGTRFKYAARWLAL